MTYQIIDEWPGDLVDLLVSPKPSEPVSIWIGSGLAAELGYPLTTPLVERLIETCREEQCDPAAIRVAREYLDASQYRMAVDQCRDTLNDQARFRAIIVNEFRQKEETDTGLQACENILKTPFAAYVTTNYNMSLSDVSQELAERNPVYKLGPDSVYPMTLHPRRLLERRIHYIHANITAADSIILGERDFLRAYQDGSELPEFLRHLFADHHLVFLGTEARDDPIMWILLKMQTIFQEAGPRLRYIILPTTEEGPPKVHAIEGTYGIQPIWYTVEYHATQTQYGSEKRIENRLKLYRLLSDLTDKTQSAWPREERPKELPERVVEAAFG